MLNKFGILVFLCVYAVLFSQNKRIPIFAFHGIPPGEYSTKENFLTMKNAGIDICYTLFNTNEEVLHALDAAQEAGTKLVIRVQSLFSDTENSVNLFKNHPALYGYCIADEPSPSQFDELIEIVKKIKRFDSEHVIYINLFPNYVSREVINGYNYQDYLNAFLQRIPVDFLSFDHYPIINNNVRGDWYSNLETVRNVSLKHKINFWAFACSTIHYSYLQPTVAGIKLQQFSNLLYGAQGLQYFAYWTLTYEYNWVKEKYGYSIVDGRGNPTPTYNVIKTVNQQIQRLAWVFSGAKSNSVFHMGDDIPKGTIELKAIPKQFLSFTINNNSNALVSFMSNHDKKFIIIQNKSLGENLTLSYKLKLPLNKVNNNTGKILSLVRSKKYTNVILPGDILIFTYDK
ncbi:hypothetical protein MUU74_09485 [Chryseobacterium daecheongense]|uniref:hypothetical protein n=1 Tax=Chryseobacterium daecheongense TaxID=192389 RepID=UPI001FD6E69C|nr:hypothetical protein [Chryseobacterium daecheongense]UOU96726.1 hypothetical protein MUU74_09485 [Chryseobacterium daecheongense]